MSKATLKFLADESLEYSVVLYLRELGYDISAIAEDSPSIKDTQVLQKANQEKRILLTNDKDFGDLVFLNHLDHKGVVLFRLKRENVLKKTKVFRQLLEQYSDQLPGNFVVVEEEKIRIRS